MRRLLSAGLVVCSLLVGDAAAQEPKAPTGDAAKLQGLWEATALESDGAARSENAYSGTILTFAADCITFSERGQPAATFRFEVDSKKTPAAIDFIMIDGPREGERLRGVYELKADALKICFSIGGPRPEKLETRPGSKSEMFTLKRLPAELPWKRHVAKDDGYSVEMPGEPEARRRRENRFGVDVEATVYVVRSHRERLSYLAMGYKLPVPLNGEAETNQAVTKAVEQLTKEFQGRVVRERTIPVEGGICREHAIHSALGPYALSRMYLFNDRLYMLQVVGIEDLQNSKSAQRFFDSFKQE